MSYEDLDRNSGSSGARDAEETLRLIARLPAPEGLEERVKAGLRSAPRMGQVLAWPSPMVGGWLRTAAAAAIVFVVAGGCWGIYSRVQPGQPAKGVAGPQMGAPGGFTEGGAVRRPQTLTGPVVTVPSPTVPAAVGTPKSKTPAKGAATRTPIGQSKIANKAGARPAASAVQ
jgi:hypothetical protein